MERCVLCGLYSSPTQIPCDRWACPFPYEDKEDRIELDEDDDEIGAEWDEMSQWDLDGDDDDDDEEE